MVWPKKREEGNKNVEANHALFEKGTYFDCCHLHGKTEDRDRKRSGQHPMSFSGEVLGLDPRATDLQGTVQFTMTVCSLSMRTPEQMKDAKATRKRD